MENDLLAIGSGKLGERCGICGVRQYCIVKRASKRYGSTARSQVVANIIDYDDDARSLRLFDGFGSCGGGQSEQTQGGYSERFKFPDDVAP